MRNDGYLAHCWSLAVEEQFYFLWPPILVCLLKHVPSKRSLAVIVGLLALISLGDRVLLCWLGYDEYRLYNGLDTRSDGILLGAAVAIAVQCGAIDYSSLRSQHILRWSILPVLLAVGCLLMTLYYNTAAPYLWGFAATAVATIFVIGVVLGFERHWLKTVLSSRVLVWLGQRSYAIYLWHYPAFHLLRRLGMSDLSTMLWAYSLTLIVAELSWRLVEQPVLRHKHKLQPRRLDEDSSALQLQTV